MSRIVRSLTLLACLALLVWAPRARAASVFFPGDTPPPTQVARELTLQEAARAGAVQLTSKGGYNGDAVAMEVKGKRLKAPVTVTVRVEWHLPERVTDPVTRDGAYSLITEKVTTAEAQLNAKGYTSSKGDPIRFRFETRFRLASEAPTPGFHQGLLLNPATDLDPPYPNPKDYRAESGFGAPNKYGATRETTFGTNDFTPAGIQHEFGHLSGLNDRYEDVYTVGGKTYSLPVQDPTPAQLTAFRKTFTPPLKAGGKLGIRNLKSAGPCDLMGTQSDSACRRLNQQDLDYFAAQAGIQVTAQPGDVLLNKDESKQDLGVGFTSIVFATPGSTTTANGVSAYCLEHERGFPIGETFDVAPTAGTIPGYENVTKLLALSGQLATNLDTPPDGMQAALWNVADNQPLVTSGSEDAARALLAQAGVAEDGTPGGVSGPINANTASPATGGVGADGAVLPVVPAQDVSTPPSAIRAGSVTVTPNRLRARRRARGQLLVVANGGVQSLDLALQRKLGRRWKAVRSLGTTPFDATAGRAVVRLSFGRLKRGRYRIAVTLTDDAGAKAVTTARLRVTR